MREESAEATASACISSDSCSVRLVGKEKPTRATWGSLLRHAWKGVGQPPQATAVKRGESWNRAHDVRVERVTNPGVGAVLGPRQGGKKSGTL